MKLPQDTDAERSTVGSVFLESACLPAVKAIVQPGDFHDMDCRLVFEAMLTLDGAGSPIDDVTVGDALRAKGVGSVAGMLEPILTAVPSSAHAAHYAAVVARYAARRRLLEASITLGERAVNEAEPVELTIEWAREELALAAAASGQGERFDLATEVSEAIASLSPDTGKRRWMTGVDALDYCTGGFAPGQHWVIGGRSQHAKTSLAVNMMLACLGAGGSVVMARYEETAREVLLRMASQASGIPHSDARLRRLSEYDAQSFVTALDALNQFGGRLTILVGEPLAAVEATVQARRPWLVIYDTLQAMALQQAEGEHRHDLAVGRICGFASRLALRYEHAAVTVSQLQKGTTGVPSMTNLRESGAIEESADVAVLSWWPFVEQGDSVCQDRIVLKLGKNRPGGTLPKTVSGIIPGTQRVTEKLSRDDATDFLETCA